MFINTVHTILPRISVDMISHVYNYDL